MNIRIFTIIYFLIYLPLYAQQPNIIVVMTDDQGYGDIAAHGNPIVRTPNLDKLHDESIRFTNFHVDPICAPTRGALMTGRYARRVGVRATFGTGNYLHVNEKTIAEIFSSMGYRTSLFGKWHLGGNYPLRPIDRGFEEWVGHGDGGGQTTNDYWNNDKWNDHYLHNGVWESHEGFMTDVFFNEAMDYINNGDNRPFFVYLASNVPHQPWNTPKEWIEPYTSEGESELNALFYASVERVDYNVGRLRKFLSDNGLAENTIIVFLTDNGTANRSSYNAGMRGRKGDVYEGGHRVPLFFNWPGRWGNKGRDVPQLSAHIDIFPTLVNLVGDNTPTSLPDFDGKDLTPLLDGSTKAWPNRQIIVDKQQSKLIVDKNSPHVVMEENYRLVNGKELYDISKDPGQTKDISRDNSTIVKNLNEAYNSWWEDMAPTASTIDTVIVGNVAQDTIFLTGLDWSIGSKIIWCQGHARMGLDASGEHIIKVESPGIYQFSLRRWPRESGLGLRDSSPTLSDSSILRVDQYCWQAKPGISLDITSAKISINGKEQIFNAITDTTKEVIFEEWLDVGSTSFQTWFEAKNFKNLGAYYVYINRKTPIKSD